jgi:hypothetical protein
MNDHPLQEATSSAPLAHNTVQDNNQPIETVQNQSHQTMKKPSPISTTPSSTNTKRQQFAAGTESTSKSSFVHIPTPMPRATSPSDSTFSSITFPTISSTDNFGQSVSSASTIETPTSGKSASSAMNQRHSGVSNEGTGAIPNRSGASTTSSKAALEADQLKRRSPLKLRVDMPTLAVGPSAASNASVSTASGGRLIPPSQTNMRSASPAPVQSKLISQTRPTASSLAGSKVQATAPRSMEPSLKSVGQRSDRQLIPSTIAQKANIAAASQQIEQSTTAAPPSTSTAANIPVKKTVAMSPTTTSMPPPPPNLRPGMSTTPSLHVSSSLLST